jgi:hypothetical protein
LFSTTIYFIIQNINNNKTIATPVIIPPLEKSNDTTISDKGYKRLTSKIILDLESRIIENKKQIIPTP